MVQTLPSFDGTAALLAADQVRPLMTLTVYKHAVIMRKDLDGAGAVEYPVDPSQLAQALAAKASFSTGFLDGNTLFVGQSGSERTVIEYREAQITGLWLEGMEDPLRVPLPPLIMARTTTADRSPTYRVYAVKQRPQSPKERLYWAPLPHVNEGVCWGTVAHPSAAALKSSSLNEDWTQFLGSRFGNHSVSGKSKSHKGDVRSWYFELAGRPDYPLDDLIPAKKLTLAALTEP